MYRRGFIQFLQRVRIQIGNAELANLSISSVPFQQRPELLQIAHCIVTAHRPLDYTLLHLRLLFTVEGTIRSVAISHRPRRMVGQYKIVQVRYVQRFEQLLDRLGQGRFGETVQENLRSNFYVRPRMLLHLFQQIVVAACNESTIGRQQIGHIRFAKR
uniref:Uncharacterized protein n=1 Tax=Anopheles christyi TaxID=43041 RepID=A0A182KHT7_9DIPT